MFVYKYIRKDNGELLGYHLDSFGSLGPKEQAKRYGGYGDDEEIRKSQTEIIQRGLEFRLNPAKHSWLYDIYMKQKETEYQGLDADQIELVLEEVEYVDVEPKVHTIIHSDGTVEKL